MITTEQNKEITQYLVSKNLPIDLVLEIKDHMIEQIESKENMSFDEAFEQVKVSWKEELKMVYNLRIPFKKMTAYQKKIVNKMDNEIFYKTIKFCLPFFILSSILTIYNKDLSKNLFFIVYLIISITTAFSLIFFYKINRTNNFSNRNKKISIYQRNSQSFFIGGMYVFTFNFISFDSRFEKFYVSLYFIYSNFFENFSLMNILNIFFTYIFIFFWLFGLLYFISYKKSIKELQNRVNLKL